MKQKKPKNGKSVEREFYLRCRDILIQRLRPRWNGAAPALRRRVCALMRARRHDLAWLRRTSRLALASPAFAFALLGASPEASAAPFQDVAGSGNPFDGVMVSGYPNCAFVDLDGDTDKDAFFTQYNLEHIGTPIRYYRNNGNAANPDFAEVTGVQNPLNGLILKDLTFGDIDDDGDLDLFCSGSSSVRFFENTGSAVSPGFVERIGAMNPMNGLPAANSVAQPFVADIDSDGDLDMFVGGQNGEIRYFQNQGDAESPAFVQQTGSGNPLDGDHGGLASIELMDMDFDGDLDAVVGVYGTSALLYFENSGTPFSPAFVQRSGGANPFNAFSFSGARTGLADIEADGDIDVFVCKKNPYTVTFLRNDEPPRPTPTPAASPTPDATATPTPEPCCPGDADNSGSFVDANDFIAVQANFGADNGLGGLGDADCSGSFVDANDFIAVQANFGADCG